MSDIIAPQHRALAESVAAAFTDLPQVRAVVLSGSLLGPLPDAHSDLDIYVYTTGAIPLATRADIAAQFAGDRGMVELDNPYWGTEDAFVDARSGLLVELMYRSTDWITEQIERVLVRHQASVGYSTAFWYNVRHALPLVDAAGWYAALQGRAAGPYPDALRADVLRLNHPLLRTVAASFRHQIELAIMRQDRVSVNHRTTALLASYFDVLFALNRQPHSGEKRLIPLAQRLCERLPERFAADVDALLRSTGAPWDAIPTLACIDALCDRLDALLIADGVLTSGGTLITI